MKKSLLLTFTFIVILMLFAGCNSVANEKQIQADLESYTQSELFAENEKIVEIKIDKRQTANEKKQESVWCTVTTEDKHYSYEKAMTLTYNYYNEGGWMLDNVSVNNHSEWVITPLTGISNEEVSASLDGISVTANDEIWNITKGNIKSISIEEQKTDLENKTDVITATLTIDDEVEEASGQLVINYRFNNEWVIDSISGNENFKAILKSGIALNVTEETLQNEISGQTSDYGIDGNATITINKNEISDFKIESQESYEKGRRQIYLCSCKLIKPHAEFLLNVEIPYDYLGSDGWSIQPITINAQCTSINLEGEWKGTYRAIGGGGTAVLNISAIDDNGLITGTFKYTPNRVDKYSQPGSYNITGEITLATLSIHFTAGEWIDKPSEEYEWQLSDISATLDIENSTLYGTAPDSRTLKVVQ